MFSRSSRAASSLLKFAPFGHSVANRTIILLPTLPYPIEQGVLPLLSPRALEYHFNGHLANYVKKANELVTGSEFHGEDVEDIAVKTVRDAKWAAMFQNVSQIYNHRFFFNGLIPGGRAPSNEMLEVIRAHFESLESLQKKFDQYALAVFGSGWCWLVDRDGDLEIMVTNNAYNTLALPPSLQPAPRPGLTSTRIMPLLACDVWEHSYYTDYNFRKQEYLNAFWKTVNWDFVARNLVAAKKAADQASQVVRR